MPLADWQMLYNGLTVGDNTPYELAKVEGLADQPDVRTSDQTRLRRHGLLPGDDFLGGRSVVLTVEVFGADDATFRANLDALKLAFKPGQAEAPLAFLLPGLTAAGFPKQVNARPRRLALPADERFFYRQPIAVVELFATDPLIYDVFQQSLVTTLPTAGGGLQFPATFNLVFGAVATGGSIFANNAGTFPAPWTARIDGPCSSPSVENVATGQRLSLSAQGGLSLASGEFVVLDTATRTILLGGTASRYSNLSSDSVWFDLAPGSNELRFRAVTGSTAQLTATWRSAWH